MVLLLVGVHLVWRMASGLSTCLAMTWQACAFIAAAARTRLLSSHLQWTRSFLTLCQAKAKQGLSTLMSRIASVFKACTGQTAHANKMTADLQLMTAQRDGLAARLQVLHWLICYTTCLCSLPHSMLAWYIKVKPLAQCSHAITERLLLADALQCHCIFIRSSLFKQQ